MQVIETNDPVEAQLCRRARYVGFPTAVALGGSKFVGLVQSVKQEVGPRWIVTIIPKHNLKSSRSRGIDQIIAKVSQFARENYDKGSAFRAMRALYIGTVIPNGASWHDAY
jgi:hypothetical protein